MSTTLLKIIGFFLVFLLEFLLSLFHLSLCLSSKISLSRALEAKQKEFRSKILDSFEEIKAGVEFSRNLLLGLLLVYLVFLFPTLKYRLIWVFLAFLILYFFFFDYLPRLIYFKGRKNILDFFLSRYRIFLFFSPQRLIGAKSSASKKEEEGFRETTEEEIETFIDEAKEEGIIEKDEDVLLRSVVEFSDTLVREIMTPRVDMVCISKEATIEKLRNLIRSEKYSRIPVYKERIDNIEGIVIAKDLLEHSADSQKDFPIEPLIRPVHFVPETIRVSELLREFQKRKQKMGIVVDEHGSVSGLVTMEDVLEEIVGEIQDEHDTDETEIVENGPFDYTVSGDVEMDQIEKLFESDLAEDNYITVSGMIIHDLGRLPKKGEVFQIKGLTLEILDVNQRRIRKLRIRRPP